jgi:hypothetical protein
MRLIRAKTFSNRARRILLVGKGTKDLSVSGLARKKGWEAIEYLPVFYVIKPLVHAICSTMLAASLNAAVWVQWATLSGLRI